jgi:hypothetical protein
MSTTVAPACEYGPLTSHQTLVSDIASQIASLSPEDLSDHVEDAEQSYAEGRAEYGMGAVSMGFDPYEVAPFHSPRLSEFIAQGRARLAELYPPAPRPAPVFHDDDLPF